MTDGDGRGARSPDRLDLDGAPTEQELLARAGELPGARDVAEGRFAPIIASPLLIRRVRSAGGVGGRRISAGVALGPENAFAILVEASGKEPSLRMLGSAQACAHAFADELRRAARDGLGSEPEPVAVGADQLLAAGAALLR